MTALFCWSATAQNGVTVSNLDVKPGTVTFNVSWNNEHPTDFLWSDSVWVFVDYNKNGVMTRLPVTSATATAGTVTKIQGNDKGVWVIGNARSAGNFSATVRLLTDITDVAGACAYASNYPPVGEYTSANKIKFTGTPEYNIVLRHSNGTTDTLQSGKIFLVPDGDTLKSFSDKTGAPGFIGVRGTPPYARSSQTWTFGSSTLTWSDRILADPPLCEKKTSLSSDATNMEFLVANYNDRDEYYYSWSCVSTSATYLCPAPWRIPTIDELVAISPLSATEITLPTWAYIGYYCGGSVLGLNTFSSEWSITPNSGYSCYIKVNTSGTFAQDCGGWRQCAMPVRCCM
jgi:hypothetical protein